MYNCIGMLVESMAGKSGSMNGVFQDATPFQFHEERKVIDYLGEQLRWVRNKRFILILINIVCM